MKPDLDDAKRQRGLKNKSDLSSFGDVSGGCRGTARCRGDTTQLTHCLLLQELGLLSHASLARNEVAVIARHGDGALPKGRAAWWQRAT